VPHEIAEVAGDDEGIEELQGQRGPEDIQLKLRLSGKDEVSEPGKNEARGDKRRE
jgi:hypothetical protein